MVIGIEGNVHVGKTTYIKNNFKDYNIINEIKFKPLLNDFDRQLYYINEEKNRKKVLLDKSVLDRTVLSTVIYTMYTDCLSLEEKKEILKKVDYYIKNNEIIFPFKIYLILYPYKLISLNHEKLFQEKGTQNSLVDYEYYLNYSLYFSERNRSFSKIVSTRDYRQIISYNNSIFDEVTKKINLKSRVLIDECPAIGKTTLCKSQKKYKYIEEFKYKKYTLEDYSNQINSIVERVNVLNQDNIIVDTSFLMGITHLLYNEITTKKFKLKVINEIMEKIPLNSYITQINYLILEKNEIIVRKNNDNNKVRRHFNNNFNYLDKEINFYKILDKRLGMMSNIKLIDASTSVDVLVKMIEERVDKPLMLIDLFYEISQGIIEGEL